MARPNADNPERGLARRRTAIDGEVEAYSPRPRRAETDEFPSDEDIERFSDVTVRCPECGADLYDDVAVCWKCGHVLGSTDRRERRLGLLGLVIVAIVVVAIAVTLLR